MESALHQDHGDAGEAAYDEPALVARGGADREVGDGAVGDDGGLLDEAGQATQARAADQAQHWPHLIVIMIISVCISVGNPS